MTGPTVAGRPSLLRGQFPTRWPTLWLWYLLAGLAAVAAYYLLPDGLLRSAVYAAIGFSAAAAILVGARIHRPSRRLPWQLMAYGLALWAVADYHRGRLRRRARHRRLSHAGRSCLPAGLSGRAPSASGC